MNYNTKYVIFLSLCLLHSIGCLNAQNSKQCIEIAQELHDLGEFKEAIGLYKRVMYFEKELAPITYFNIAENYLAIKDIKRAHYYYSLAEESISNDSINLEISFRIIASYILQDELLFAKNELLGFPTLSTQYFKKKYNFYAGIIEFRLHELDEAEMYFLKVFNEEQVYQLYKYLEQSKTLLNKKPNMALALSVFIPGLGQAYANEWGDAANSFFINLLTTSLYLFIWSEYSYIDAIISVLPWWHRYYVGGFTNAKETVIKKKNIGMDHILADILLLYSMTIPTTDE